MVNLLETRLKSDVTYSHEKIERSDRVRNFIAMSSINQRRENTLGEKKPTKIQKI